MLGIRTIRVLAGTAVLAALGFGATQAPAQPAPHRERGIVCPFGTHSCICPVEGGGAPYCTYTDVPCPC